jgi:hypothetical protein
VKTSEEHAWRDSYLVISMQVIATAVFNESQFLHFYVASNNTVILYFYKVWVLKGCGIVFMQQELFGQVCMFIERGQCMFGVLTWISLLWGMCSLAALCCCCLLDDCCCDPTVFIN